MTEAGLELLKLVGRRSDLLDALLETPLEKRDLEERLDESRSTVDRALKELEETGLATWDGSGYRVTLAGRIQLQIYRSFVERSTEVLDTIDFLGNLPPEAPVGPGLLVGSEVVDPGELNDYELAPVMADILESAERAVVALSGDMSPESIRKLVRKINDRGVAAETFLAPDLVSMLESGFPGLLGALAAGDCRVHEAPVEHFGLLFDPDGDRVAIGADSDTGERLGLVHNQGRAPADWARGYVEDLRASATEVTSEARRMARLGGDRETLATQGFVDLAGVEPRETAPLTTGWRTGLDLAEVAAGLAVDRERPVDGGRQSVAGEVRELLETGHDVAVLGPRGSGKSTVCKTVAWDWHADDRGPVLYRESGGGEPFQAWPLLAELLRDTDDHALVVVEDAVRAEANDVFRVMGEFIDADDVTILLDAREGEWHEPPSFPADARLETYRIESVETVTMPPLDEREVERFVERFEEGTDVTVTMDPEQLYAAVRNASGDEATPAALQLLLHRLSLRAAPLVADQHRTPTTLVEDVRRTITAVQPDGDLGLEVAALANLLNAAGIGPRRPFLHAVACAHDGDQGRVEESIGRLEGRVLFPDGDGYRAVHESWSALFLETLQSDLGEERAAETVGTAVTALLALADDADRRESIAANLADRRERAGEQDQEPATAEALERIADAPADWAAGTVEQLFDAAREYPALAPLFGVSGDDTVELPSVIPSPLRSDVVKWRGEAYLEGGYLDRAAAEFEELRERLPERSGKRDGRALAGLGTVAFRRGDVDEAAEQYDAALAAATEHGDTERVATSHKHLGNVDYVRGDLESAEEHYRVALDTYRELDDRLGVAYARHNLGNVVDVGGGDPVAAEEHYRAALETYRELGNRGDEADCLNNLGVIAENRGDLATAADHYRSCLERYRELGDRIGQANALANIGLIDQKRGALDDAETFATRARDRYREVGDSQGKGHALGILADVAFQRGNVEAAAELVEESHGIYEEIGDRKGLTMTNQRRCKLELARGALDAAEAAGRRAIELAEAVGRERSVARSRALLGDLARRQGDHDVAVDHLEASRDAYESLGDGYDQAVALGGLAELSVAEGEPDRAMDHLREAVAVLDEVLDDRIDAGVLLVTGCEQAGFVESLQEPLGETLARADEPLAERLDALDDRLDRR